MAEVASRGKQPAKQHKPSRLRNEVHIESTDDERELDKPTGVEPCSDNTILDTKLHQNDHFNGPRKDIGDNNTNPNAETLDQDAEALIKRTAANKAVETSTNASFEAKFYSKEAFAVCENLTSQSSPCFSFAKVTKHPSKATPQKVFPLLNSAAQAVATSDPIHEETCPTASTEPLASGRVQQSHVLGGSTSMQLLWKAEPSPQISEADPDQHKFSETTSEGQGSAPPATRSTDQIYPIYTVRDSKKGKRLHFSQQRGQTERPISQIDDTRHYTSFCSTASHSTSDTTAASQDLNLSKHNEFSVESTNKVSPEISSPVQNCPIDTQHHERNVPQVDDKINNSHEETYSQSMEHRSEKRVWDPNDLFRQDSSLHPAKFPLMDILDKKMDATDAKPLKMHQPVHNLATSQAEHANSEPSNAERNTRRPSNYEKCFKALPQSTPDKISQCSQSFNEINEVRKHLPHHKKARAVLQKSSSREGHDRVLKAHQKDQASSGDLTHAVHAVPMQSAVERSMESLRIALLAERFRIQHETAMRGRSHEETVGTLRGLVEIQNSTISEWKGRYQDLRNTVHLLTERAKTNQKYVTGLHVDYEKLRKSVGLFQDKARMTLEDKIAELEREKRSLHEDFTSTIDTLTKNIRSSKATMDDFYMRLVISESKRRDATTNLQRQEVMYEEERNKCHRLERELSSSIQNVKLQITGTSANLTDKMQSLQSSLDRIANDDYLQTEMKECSVILRSIQSAPYLTVNSVNKAEGMLRYLYERIESGFGAVLDNIHSKGLSAYEIQAFIKSQFQEIRTDMSKYDEIVAENSKAHESINTLKEQLKATMETSKQMNDQTKALQQVEAGPGIILTEHESQLTQLGDNSSRCGSETVSLECGANDWKQQLKKAQHDLQLAIIRAENSERLKRDCEHDAVKYKNWYGSCKSKLLDIDRKVKLEKKTERIEDLREMIARDCQKSFAEKESNFKNEIHRLTVDLDEKNAEMQAQQKEVDAAKDQLQILRKSIKAVNSELNTIRDEKIKMERRLSVAQLTQLPSTMDMHDQLSRLREELQSKNKDHMALQQKYAELSIKATNLQDSYENVQTKAKQHHLPIDNLHQKPATPVHEVQHNSQDQCPKPQAENQGSATVLEKINDHHINLNNSEIALHIGINSLQQQLAARQAAMGKREAGTQTLQDGLSEEIGRSKNNHRLEIDKINHRLIEAERASKEAEAKTRPLEAEHNARLQSDREYTEKRLQLLQSEFDRNLEEANAQSIQLPQQISQPVQGENFINSLHKKQAGIKKKKVNRKNKSALCEISGTVTQPNPFVPLPECSLGPPNLHSEDSELSLTLFEEIFGNSIEDDDVSNQKESSKDEPAVGVILKPHEDVNNKINRGHCQERERQNSSSTDLSTIGSEEILQMQMDIQQISTPLLRGHDRSSSNPLFSSHSPLSQGRPKSQANTASRIMHPSDSVGSRPSFSQLADDVTTKALKQRGTSDTICRDFISSSRASSPDFMDIPSSNPKHNFTQSDRRDVNNDEYQQNISNVLDRSQKRKSSLRKAEQDKVLKRRRVSVLRCTDDLLPVPGRASMVVSEPSTKTFHSEMKRDSPSVHISSSIASRSRSPLNLGSGSLSTPKQSRFSGGRSRSQSQRLSSTQDIPVSTANQAPSRSTRSKRPGISEVIEDRFLQELGRQ